MADTTRTYVPVCPEHHVGGPIGYVLEQEAGGVCPIIARREPVLAEAFEQERAAIEGIKRSRLETE